MIPLLLSTSNEPVEVPLFDELLDLVSKMDSFFSIVMIDDTGKFCLDFNDLVGSIIFGLLGVIL